MNFIIFLSILNLVLADNFDLKKYEQQFNSFCSGVNKRLCTKELLEFGMNYLKNYYIMLEHKAQNEQQLMRKAAKIRRLEQMKKQKFTQTLREHFLDRHI
jgi:hypothetical protein